MSNLTISNSCVPLHHCTSGTTIT